MLQPLKSNKYIRKILYNTLKNVMVSRRYPNSSKRLYFEAGKNLNLFFKPKVVIEPLITSKILAIAKKCSLFYDIGANIGFYSVLLSHLNKLKIISIEPDENNIKVLKQNITLNRISNIMVVEEALSSGIGIVTFYSDKNTGRTSSIEKGAWHPAAVEIMEQKIRTITLDNLAENYGYPDLIKCDVEGHELEVLTGAVKVLSSKATWFIETTKENFANMYSIFHEKGYALYNSESADNDKLETPDKIVPNLLCIHKSRLNDFRNSLNI